MKYKLSSLLVPVVLLMSQPGQAEDLDAVIHAMREGNFAEAYCILRPHADAGDADAQYNIGWMYLNGYGLAINDSLALEWWQRASKQGHPDANFSIAMLYNLGEGQVKKDIDKAIDYYLLAIEDGHEDARMILTSMLQRNDKSIRDRRLQIINTYGSLLGTLKQVKGKRINVRGGPGMDHPVVASLEQGSVVLALYEKGNWTNVVMQDSGETAWIYNSLLEEHVVVDASNTEAIPSDMDDAVVQPDAADNE